MYCRGDRLVMPPGRAQSEWLQVNLGGRPVNEHAEKLCPQSTHSLQAMNNHPALLHSKQDAEVLVEPCSRSTSLKQTEVWGHAAPLTLPTQLCGLLHCQTL